MNVILTAGSPLLFSGLNSSAKKMDFLANFEKMLDSYYEWCDTKVLVLPLILELDLRRDILSISHDWKCQFINGSQGSLATAMLGLEYCDLDQPLMVAPADSYVTDGYKGLVSNWQTEEFSGMACIIEGKDETWSYVRTDSNGLILEVAEKRRISSLATTGLFGFKSARKFLDSATWALENRFTFVDRYFMSATIQALLIQGDRTCALSLPPDCEYKYFGLLSERN